MWSPGPDRADPVSILHRDDEGRLPELLALRYERMSASPFAFFRGAASIMASDLQSTPDSGIRTQICGDAHLLNFGAFASPERRFVFDVNDFDETTPGGAWEWDLKRLVTSVELAGRHLNLRPRAIERAVCACANGYRKHMHAFAAMPVLDVWYARLDERLLVRAIRATRTSDSASTGLIRDDAGELRLEERPPLIYRPLDAAAFVDSVRDSFERYRRSLDGARRVLFERFRFVDAAYKVVGVGSVGTRCLVGLFAGTDGSPFVLQMKEARASVFARYGVKSRYSDNGERVVAGQRLMQTVADLFLGWAKASDGHTFYVRQLHDRKTGAEVDRMSAPELERYATLCGWGLARAHAKAGGRATAIAAYVGRGPVFDDALAAFARAYADQTERDYAVLLEASVAPSSAGDQRQPDAGAGERVEAVSGQSG